MVNIDKLNKTIENLDIKTKEIEGLVKTKDKIEKLAKDLGEVNNRLHIEKDNVIQMAEEVEKIHKKSKNVIDSVESIVNNKFKDYDDILDRNNDNIANMEKEIEFTLKEYTNIKNKLIELINEIKKYDDKIEVLNQSIIKELAQTKTENYKIINEFQNALDAKNSILKSDLLLEVRMIEGRLENKMNLNSNDILNKLDLNSNDILNKVDDRCKSLESVNMNIINKLEKVKEENDKANKEMSEIIIKEQKKNSYIMFIIIALIILNFIVLIFK